MTDTQLDERIALWKQWLRYWIERRVRTITYLQDFMGIYKRTGYLYYYHWEESDNLDFNDWLKVMGREDLLI